jgi:predicted DCC family thiol-disulfide oxidoreductase YuxK
MQNKLIFLFDGGCPLCLRETNFLKSKDELNKIDFVDINNVIIILFFLRTSHMQKQCQIFMGF